jgi:hypothetical protein
MNQRYGCEDKDLGHYICHRTNERIVVDRQPSGACCFVPPPHQGVCRT